MKKPHPYIIEAVPVQRLPRHLRVFDYQVGNFNLHPGDLIKIPFGRSTCQAIVWSIKNKAAAEAGPNIKTVSEVLWPGFLTAQQLALADWLSGFCGVSPALALKSFIYLLPNRKFKAPTVNSVLAPTRLAQTSSQPVVLMYQTTQQRVTTVINLLNKVWQRNQTVLLLVPENYQIDWWLRQLAGVTPAVAVWRYKQSIKEQREIWLKIKQSAVKLVIATRGGLFLPFSKLGGIVVDQSENVNYKQNEQNPHYDSITVVKRLANIYGASLALLSSAPRLEDWWLSQPPAGSHFKWRALGKKTSADFNLINLINERPADSNKIIAQPLREAVTIALRSGQNVFLYLNRLGSATVVLCRECGYIARCVSCQRPMVSSEAKQVLFCYHCRQEQAWPVPCPRCGAVAVDWLGAGVDKLYQAAKELWPQIKLVKLTGASIAESAALISQSGLGTLIVGSKAAWRYLDWSKISLIGVISPDAELSVPEFRSAERVWQTMRWFLTNGARRVIVQTYRPEHYVWRALIKQQVKIFYQAELAERKLYSYPPLSDLLRLTTESSIPGLAKKQAEAVYKLLQQHSSSLGRLAYFGPYPDYYGQVRGRERWHILIKSSVLIKSEDWWRWLPDNVIIDREPENILS